MTEIKIEKKKPIWPFLLGLAILAALLYFIFFYDRKEVAREEPAAADITRTNETDNTVAAYISFVTADTARMRLDHAYSHEALTRLADATSAVAARAGYDIQVDLDEAKAYANKIKVDPYETTHADNIRKAANLLSSAIQNMQQAKFPSLGNEAAELKKAAAAINPDVLTLDQKESVRGFFKKAADLLQKMY